MPSSGVQTCALRSEEHTSELQSPCNLVCRLLLEKKHLNADGRHEFLLPGALPPLRVRPVGRPGCVAGAEPLAAGGRREFRSAGSFLFFFNDTATTEIYTLSLHDALPISRHLLDHSQPGRQWDLCCRFSCHPDRKSTRLNSSHLVISYAVFCLKKKTA